MIDKSICATTKSINTINNNHTVVGKSLSAKPMDSTYLKIMWALLAHKRTIENCCNNHFLTSFRDDPAILGDGIIGVALYTVQQGWLCKKGWV